MILGEGKKEGLDILVTTYPEQGSRNVGDKLISVSALKLIRYRVPDYDPVMIFREESLERFEKSAVRTILAPGFSVNDGAYPNLFKLYEDIKGLSGIFYPVGCSFQHLVPLKETYENYEYSEETLNFLKTIAQGCGPLPCRDQLIVGMLDRHKVPAFYCGDLALYDDDVVGSEFVPPANIRSVVFTVQHKPKFMQQSFSMLNLIKAEFPDAELYVAHHSKVNKNSQQVSEYAKSIGFVERDLSGDISSLDFYEGIDLHIGYRLHGHISFLRRRKPSCLLIEDSRSFGIANTEHLSVGAFDGHSDDGERVDQNAPKRVIEYVRGQVESSFYDFHRLFNFVDKSYLSCVRPYFDIFSERLGWQKSMASRFDEINKI
nr:hypothetical protein [uncultured Pseudomonas sp.]